MAEKKETSVPDTATTYERAKPEAESPAGKLTGPPKPPADEKPDELVQNQAPASPTNKP